MDQQTKNPEIILHFDRFTGGLTVVAGDGAESYDIEVDDRFAGAHAPAMTPVNPARINRISDSDLELPELLWVVADPQGDRPVSKNILPEWTLSGSNTAYVGSRAEADEEEKVILFNCPVDGTAIAIEEGEDYDFQALLALHRTDGRIRMVFLDAAGHEVQAFEKAIPEGLLGGRRVSDYSLVHLIARAPRKSAKLRIEIIKGLTASGDDSFLFFARPALCRSDKATDYHSLDRNLPSVLSADIFRNPAPAGHIGSLPIPGEALDGEYHRVRLRARATGAESRSIPVGLPEATRCMAQIHSLDGSTLIAEVILPQSWRNRSTLSLWVDGQPADRLYFTTPGSSEVRIPLPTEYCDGRPHLFELRLGVSGQLLCQYGAIGPACLTPWDSLQRYAGAPLPAQLAPLAAYRYRSLAEGPSPAAQPDGPTQQELHDILVEGFQKPRQDFRILPFRSVDEPDVSIVIPVHDKFDTTYSCLAALLYVAGRIRFEVIVVDDGSTDTTTKLDQIAPGVTIVRHATAQGFVGACNAGAAAARGRYIVFLNNDTEPTALWLDEMRFVFDNFDDVGLVGAKLIYPDGTQQEAGGIVWETGDPWNYGRRGNPFDPRYSYTRMCDYVSGAAIMIPADLWRSVGGFSAEFAPAYFEDTDLAFKVRAAGKRVVFAPRSVVVHYEGHSNGTDNGGATGLKRYQEVNRPKFKRKWPAHFAGNGKVGVDTDRAKDRGITKRVVFFDFEFPRLDADAGSYAAIQEMRMFQALGCKVTFVPLNMAYLGRHTEYLQRLGVETIHSPFFADADHFLRVRGNEFDLAYITRYGVAEQLFGPLSQHAPQARVVLNVADLHFLRQIREGIAERNDTKLQAALATRNAEIAAIGRAELVLSYSAVEQAVISSHVVAGPRTGVLPWVVDPRPDVVPFGQRRDIAFVGGFRHPPNEVAVKFFVDEVMPLLRQQLPGVRFAVYGSNVTPLIESLSAGDVIIKGYIRDLAEVFDTCRIFVSPLQSGAGIKGKVLDCIAAGVPSVLSSLSAEGTGLRNGIDAIIADRSDDVVKAIVHLYRDEAAWNAMSASALDLARTRYSFDSAVAGLRDALASIDFYPGDRPALSANSARPLVPVARSPDTAAAATVAAVMPG